MAARPIVIRVQVKPNARVSSLARGGEGIWIAQVKATPVDGKANAELIALVATKFECRKSAVQIRSGASGRIKLVRIAVD